MLFLPLFDTRQKRHKNSGSNFFPSLLRKLSPQDRRLAMTDSLLEMKCLNEEEGAPSAAPISLEPTVIVVDTPVEASAAEEEHKEKKKATFFIPLSDSEKQSSQSIISTSSSSAADAPAIVPSESPIHPLDEVAQTMRGFVDGVNANETMPGEERRRSLRFQHLHQGIRR